MRALIVMLMFTAGAYADNLTRCNRLANVGKVRIGFEPALQTANGIRQTINLGAISLHPVSGNRFMKEKD